MKLSDSTFLWSFTLALIVLTLLCIGGWEVLPSSWLRILAIGIFLCLGCFVISAQRNFLFLLLFLFLFLTVDISWLILGIKIYEQSIYYLLHAAIVLAVTTFLLLDLRKKVLQISFLEIFSLAAIFSFNCYFLFLLGDWFSEEIKNSTLLSLVYVKGFSILLLIMVSFLYSVNYAKNGSLYLFIAILALVSSQILRFSIHFLQHEDFRYLDDIFYTLGLASLTQFFGIDGKRPQIRKSHILY